MQTALPQRDDGVVDVVTSTAIVADLVENVTKGRARVTSLMPPGADPHSYEPTLRDVRNIANADIAFTNGLLLEDNAFMRTIETNTRPETEVIHLAENASSYGINYIPLVENVSLDTIWLGLRVRGNGANLGANKQTDVKLSATGMRVNQITSENSVGAEEKPAPTMQKPQMAGFLTSTFGQAEIYFNSKDGFQANDNYKNDTAILPADAHTHMSWAFSAPGIYQVDFKAELSADALGKTKTIGSATVTFAVGVNAHGIPGKTTVLDHGHQDITVNLEQGRIVIEGDSTDQQAGIPHSSAATYDPETTVIAVPNKSLQRIPGEPQFRFLGKAGEETYLLPQAVLGKHVHGEIDPHLWHNVSNVIAYVELIRDELIKKDPAGARIYSENAQAYIVELNELDTYMREKITDIPPQNRHLVTTHDGYGYLGAAYNLHIAGFVTPNPAIEPSARDLIALTRTLQNLQVKAVFLEPNLSMRANNLTQVAQRLDVQICTIYGDTFDEKVDSYIKLMRFNADSLHQCLTGNEGK
ncbi:anchored repeat ABC transporter, substrate-binding protein [Gleimia sp. 6138-11-ORH1]|uniref:anchored repeat ABC transporter, substrate-binding protein n=1 Tax=Gleimia sp. 6138-11-ORH1 TaxID=2973937 RepID=UPI0021686B89|nr:anchored repeat ABC transporter, substrate-binding protein [Gleimia sp. 6138-11-ORH1]MCS4485016.1 anchored repeat ABC transporter, substrate-binding protein [Gleimia sp. 6138-11-ORH1]